VPYPYATTVNGLTTTLTQLRSAFPNKINADTLKKWGIALNNEHSILNTIRFLGLVDADGNKDARATAVFVIHDDVAFGREFADLVQAAYADLFELHGDQAWTLDRDKLINFFRTSDTTSARVGELQAATFTALAGVAGHAQATAAPNGGVGPRPRPARRSSKEKGATKAHSAAAPAPTVAVPAVGEGGAPGFKPGSIPLSISVRIELNLPVSDKQEVYDNIFRSIRENFIDA
jgi:hypothetical protein